VRRDVLGWRDQLAKTLAASTVNHHLASASGFLAWVAAQAPNALPAGNPATGVGTLALPPLEPRALNPAQVRSLKSVVDRLERFHQLKGRRAGDHEASHAHGRPLRDRAIVYLLLSTGLRREELVNLDLDQLAPAIPAGLRAAKRARLTGVRGKGNTTRTVFISADARVPLADYLEAERPDDVGKTTTALFCSAASIASRHHDGQLSTRAVNLILERIGAWHDAEQTDQTRRLGQLRPTPCATPSPSLCRSRPITTPTNSSAASVTAPSATSPATPTRPKTWPPPT